MAPRNQGYALLYIQIARTPCRPGSLTGLPYGSTRQYLRQQKIRATLQSPEYGPHRGRNVSGSHDRLHALDGRDFTD